MQYQIELWEECNNHCDFCFLGKENYKTPDNIKLNSIQRAYEKLLDDNFINQYDNISLIGGEFFQGQLNTPEIKENFYKLVKRIFELLKSGKIESSWITATLTIGYQQDLYDLLDYWETLNINKEKQKLWICTSYDTKGRFHTDRMLEIWKYHMKKLSNYNIYKNTTIILTEDFMNKVLSDEINLYEFEKEYGTSIFLKHAAIGSYNTKEELEAKVPNFFPKRETTLEFLEKLYDEYPTIFKNTLNIQLRADLLEKNYNNDNQYMVVRHKDSIQYEETDQGNIRQDCGHIIEYSCYIDSDECILCDKNNIAI